MAADRHLILQEFTLEASEERLPRFKGWLMARVFDGCGYWLQHGASARQLTVGDGFIVAGKANGIVRASALGLLKLQFFAVHPQNLTGVFTVAEWHQFEIIPQNSPLPVLFFKASEAVGQKFARIVGLSHNDQLPIRCALLQLWATATAKLLPVQASITGNDLKLRERFRQVVGEMPEIELCLCSPTDLAQQLHCSKRHFYRLFREEFGVPFRTLQLESRFQRRHQLLAASSAENDASLMSAVAGNSTLSTPNLSDIAR
jgi:AraC-like DNA-binding protein